MVTASKKKKTGGFTIVLTFVPFTNCDRTTDSGYAKHTKILFVQSARFRMQPSNLQSNRLCEIK